MSKVAVFLTIVALAGLPLHHVVQSTELRPRLQRQHRGDKVINVENGVLEGTYDEDFETGTQPHLNQSSNGESGVSEGRCDEDFRDKSANCRRRELTKIPDYLTADILRLDLSYNQIEVLSNDSFSRYAVLVRLDLSYNSITIVESAAFEPLRKLRVLSLNSNTRLVLPSGDVFRWLTNLTFLGLEDCDLQALPNSTLSWMPRITEIDFSSNSISNVHIPDCKTRESLLVNLGYNNIAKLTDDSFILGCNMDALILVANPIREIDPGVIAALSTDTLVLGQIALTMDAWTNLFAGIAKSSIQWVSVLSGGLRNIPPGFFLPLQNGSLHTLDLSMNDLHVLNHSIFANLTTVYDFQLESNDIESVEPEHFQGMTNLRILHLGYNDMLSINPWNTSWTINLHELYLEDNLLAKVNPQTFRGLNNLKILDLSNNPDLTVVQIGSVEGLTNLEELYLSGCDSLDLLSLSTPSLKVFLLRGLGPFSLIDPLIPGKTFNQTPSLTTIDVSGSIYSFDSLWNPAKNISLFQGLTNLSGLDLSDNSLDNLPCGVFLPLSSLKYLYLENGGISYIKPCLFFGLTSLETLHLENNHLAFLPNHFLYGLERLSSLYMNGNPVSFLETGVFDKNPVLTHLSFRNNKLTEFDQSTFSSIRSSLLDIDIAGNPVVCDCDLKWFVKLVKGDEIALLNDDQTICSPASLESLRDRPILTFDPNSLCAQKIALISVLVVAAISVIAIAILVYHHRWSLKYKLFLLKLAVLGYEQVADAREHGDFDFDLNIIFHDGDEAWAAERLRPALREELPAYGRIAFGDEDLTVTMYYLDAVHDVIERSFKTIVLLSRAAVRDHWFLIKFRTAFDYVNDAEIEKMVVVFVDDIPEEELPFLVKLYLSDHGLYLHWGEDDDVHQEYFWKTLIKYLTVNPKPNPLIPNE